MTADEMSERQLLGVIAHQLEAATGELGRLVGALDAGTHAIAHGLEAVAGAIRAVEAPARPRTRRRST
jgi:hypothetical protein